MSHELSARNGVINGLLSFMSSWFERYTIKEFSWGVGSHLFMAGTCQFRDWVAFLGFVLKIWGQTHRFMERSDQISFMFYGM